MSDTPPATRFRIQFDAEDLSGLERYARDNGLHNRLEAAGEIVCRALHPLGRHRKHDYRFLPGDEGGTALVLGLDPADLEALDEYRDQEMPGRATRGKAIGRIVGQALDRMELLRRFDDIR